MKVTLTDYTADPEFKIGQAAAECYDADTSREACLRRAAKCKDSGHLATMRFAYATFHIEGISRICSHQIVRMAHAGILQRSQRYVSEKGVEFVRPHTFDALPRDLQDRWKLVEDICRDLYDDLVAEKAMKKEDARYILLHSAETSMHLCLNFQGWQDFLRNRTTNHAQQEVRDVAFAIQDELAVIAPLLFSATTTG